MSSTVLLTLITLVLAGLFIAIGLFDHPQAINERCKLRLLRVGGAIDAWVDEHGHGAFPEILNSAPGSLWTPGRMGSAGIVLADYLGGDIPDRPRPGESQDQYLARLRSDAWTVCPATGEEYWYNDLQLASTAPDAIAHRTPPSIWYFHCQPRSDGTLPHRQSGEDGVYIIDGQVETSQVTQADLAQLRSDLAAEGQEAHPSADRMVEMEHQRERLQELETEQARLAPGTPLTMSKLVVATARFATAVP
jgi:hypothetical protein